MTIERDPAPFDLHVRQLMLPAIQSDPIFYRFLFSLKHGTLSTQVLVRKDYIIGKKTAGKVDAKAGDSSPAYLRD